MVKDASGRSDFEFLADLRDGGGVAILPDGDREKFVDALLPGSQLGKHGLRILKLLLVVNRQRLHQTQGLVFSGITARQDRFLRCLTGFLATALSLGELPQVRKFLVMKFFASRNPTLPPVRITFSTLSAVIAPL